MIQEKNEKFIFCQTIIPNFLRRSPLAKRKNLENEWSSYLWFSVIHQAWNQMVENFCHEFIFQLCHNIPALLDGGRIPRIDILSEKKKASVFLSMQMQQVSSNAEFPS